MSTPANLLPPDADLRRMVHFSAGDGRIWLAGQRMLLVHAAALGALRREMMGTIGREQTRRLLMRAGYASGERDAKLARQVRGDASVLDMFAVGPQLHMLEGAVQVTPEKCELDVAAGRFHGIFRWDHSWEVAHMGLDFPGMVPAEDAVEAPGGHVEFAFLGRDLHRAF
ncbi:MAG: AAA family ATPase, partial [Comamonadaceae bacterium]